MLNLIKRKQETEKKLDQTANYLNQSGFFGQTVLDLLALIFWSPIVVWLF